MVRIQVKKYRKIYLTEKKGNYVCRSYYVYLPKYVAEPLVGKDLRVFPKDHGIMLERIEP